MSSPPEEVARRRRALWAVLLSLLLAGLGHMLLGRMGRAMVWLGGLLLITGIASEAAAGTLRAFGMVMVVSGFAAFDAALIAREPRP